MTLEQGLVFGAIFLGASLIQGLTGFGFGIFAVALLSLQLNDIPTAVAITSLVGFVVLGMTAWDLRRRIAWRRVLPLLPGIVLSIVVGTEFLKRAPQEVLFALLAAAVGFMSIRPLLLANGNGGPEPGEPADGALLDDVRPGWLGGTAIGLLAGFLGAAINMPGPPLIVYAYAVASPRPARSFLTAVFLVVATIRLPVFALRDVYSMKVLVISAWMLPVCAAGTMLGIVLHNRMPTRRLKQVCHVALLGLGLVLLSRVF